MVPPMRKRGRPALPESQSKRLKEWREECQRLTMDKEVEVVVRAGGERLKRTRRIPFSSNTLYNGKSAFKMEISHLPILNWKRGIMEKKSF